MDTSPVTRSGRKPELLPAPEPAVGGLGLPRKKARPPVRIQAKAVASALAGYQQELRKKRALMPDIRTGTKTKRLVCLHEGCGRSLPRSGMLTAHRRTAHSGAKPFVCPREGCGYASAASGDLKKHWRVHSGVKPFVCPREGCGYASAAAGDLKKHWRVHSGVKSFVCPREGCGYASAASGDLKKHWRVHSGEKPFVCPWENCGYASGRSDLLTRHLCFHSGEKPFECSWEGCGYASTASGDLKKHWRIHSGEKPFVCPWENCRYAFKQSNDLTRHLRVHSGEKCFVCPRGNCGYTSGRSGTLKRHLRVHAREKPFGCSHAGGGRASGGSGSRSRHVRSGANAGSLVRLGRGSTSTGARSGHSRTRANSASCFQNLEAGKPLPVTMQHPPSTVSTTAAARLNAGTDLHLAPGQQRQSTAVCSDSPRSRATVSSGACERFDQEPVPSDRHKLRSPGLNLSSAASPPAAQFEWVLSSAATGGMSDWLPWDTDHNLFEDWPALCSRSVSELELGSSGLTDDDKAFWRALLSPAHGAQ